jgi:signal transduction histidine kinase
MICYYYDAPQYLFFASDTPELLYYSHLPAMILTLLVGFFVFANNPKKLLNKLLFSIALSFSLLTIFNLITWTNNQSDLIIFVWSLFGPLQGMISILCIYFIYVFLHQKDAPGRIKLIFTLLLLPTFLLAATNLNVSGFDIAWCNAFEYEGALYTAYYNLLGLIAIIWIAWMLIAKFKAPNVAKSFKNQIILMGIGVQSFLLLFFTIFYLADYLTTINFVEDSRLELYGFFGMTLFMITMGVLIVRFKTFSVGAHVVDALVLALVLLVASQFTFANANLTTNILTSITLTLTAVTGFFLVRSVRNETRQRIELQKVTKQLSNANQRLTELDKLKSEFVSIASHQLRSPLTAIRGYASMLLDGSFGKLPNKAVEPVERIEESSKLMALGIEDYLNVSRIEAGNMKYVMIDFNLREQVEHVCDDLRMDAVKKGLALIFRTSLSSKAIVNADIGKTVQIVQNLIHNSIKYTEKGSIKVLVRDDVIDKKVHVDIEDTGIGMSEETLNKIFHKFERANNANSVNISGTGLGLYVAVKMAEEMGGTIEASSEGEGKGSRFSFTLPLAM